MAVRMIWNCMLYIIRIFPIFLFIILNFAIQKYQKDLARRADLLLIFHLVCFCRSVEP